MVDASLSPARASACFGSTSSSTATLSPNCPSVTFTNTGGVNTASGQAVYGATGTTWTVTNNGTLTTSAASTQGVYLKGTASTVLNASTITAPGSGSSAFT